LFFTGVIFFIPVKDVLSVSNRKNPSQRFYSSKAYRYGFIISYTHSVNKGRVHDYYKCNKDGTLVLNSTHFVSYGAGIPEPEETPGADFTVLNNGYIISNLNRNVPKLLMAVGVIAEHSFAPDNGLLYSGIDNIEGEIFLKDYFAAQTSLIFESKKVNYIDFLIHKVRSK